ncbi:EXS family protein [Colletotrichum abscissum]|uniref:EXS family protein n=1 Tax=Colletotrichum abscissum TaxID=1671311 RepID=A0A9P9X678_9PEZI|nr:EXS family protein [Colletotrichum abscissum]KAI3538873.1 EXS family protein [Colletotrichum abscissum]KAK1516459.1 EXS family protein [Colletotrichum abscissum]
MKFAKELEQDLVPEWRIKYLNYKAGKKYVKAVSRAINRANGSPQNNASKSENRIAANFFHSHSPFNTQKHGHSRGGNPDERTSLRHSPAPVGSARQKPATPARAIPVSTSHERQGLNNGSTDLQYGSFVHTPPNHDTGAPLDRKATFELPGPAMRVPSHQSDASPQPASAQDDQPTRQALQRSASMIADAPRSSGPPPTEHENTPSSLRLPHSATIGSAYNASPRGGLRRLFSNASPLNRSGTNPEYGLQGLAIDLVRQKEKEFFDFLDSELEKVEAFYKLKEDQAGERLSLLKDQLHEMRNRRTQELHVQKQQAEIDFLNGGHGVSDGPQKGPLGWIDPVKSKIFRPGPNSKALSKMAQTPVMRPKGGDAGRDYIRRPHEHDVPYRTAKRKLKLALQEFYRGLELLKSYALLNRTAFRKLNKKYDKAVNARPQYRYMNEKVSKSWFVNSDAVDGHIKAVEDLYARYFERGNHKLAAGKLRSLSRRPGDESGSAFRCGILLGTGLVFAIQGAVFGGQLLFDKDPEVRSRTSYLLQIYGGYFLMLLLFCMFCLNCAIWTRNKINYPFIFEFDTRHNLDWRQLAEFPSLFTFIFGVFIWLNFSEYGTNEVYEYYPVVLIAISVFIIFLPAPIFMARSRRWFTYAHWRLLLAGLYPVEFRDFFLGDIYCSLTYAMCNVELFFCIYANAWENPAQCNSSHSRLLGFLGALPPIWRFLQCLRRYKDTRNIFPHLVNGGKYTMSIMAAVSLSMYRINNTHGHLAMFITFSSINAIYTSIWDLFMDFSLLQPQSRHWLLRDITALKKRWPYYFIMVIDPILRFAWIFYAIFTHDTQHSTIVSFLVAMAEVSRRGMWTLFRVENEHCANVAQYKASRDVPLPYRIEPLVAPRSSIESDAGKDGKVPEETTSEAAVAPAASTGGGATTTSATTTARPAASSDPRAEESGTLRQRVMSGITPIQRSFSKIIAEAHRQDFEKRRKPVDAETEQLEEAGGMASDDDDEGSASDDDEEGVRSGGSEADSMEIRQVNSLVRDRGGRSIHHN